MKQEVAAVSPSESLYIADGLMSRGGLGHLPVLRWPALVGILTPGDILRALDRLAPAPEFAAVRQAVLKALCVEDAMTTAVVTIGPDASVNEAVELLLKHRVECLPVIEEGRLVGMFTTSDLLRAIAWPRDAMVDLRETRATAMAHPAPNHLGSAA